MNDPLIIAIDGFSSCGKSTLARDLAQELDMLYIDSGAMYRAVSLFFIQRNIELTHEASVLDALGHIHIHFEKVKGLNHVFLNGKDVEKEIRSPKVSSIVSEVAALSPVRRKLVQLQRELSVGHAVVMDGRDIGTVVFPRAHVKLFITADVKIRAERRFHELRQKKIKISRKEVFDNLKHRDTIDSTREDSPLRMAEDAILIDNTNLSRKQQLAKVLEIIRNYQNEEI